MLEKFSKKKVRKILKTFANFFIKANFEILSTELDTRPKIRVLKKMSITEDLLLEKMFDIS